jgi:hypothetical protein
MPAFFPFPIPALSPHLKEGLRGKSGAFETGGFWGVYLFFPPDSKAPPTRIPHGGTVGARGGGEGKETTTTGPRPRGVTPGLGEERKGEPVVYPPRIRPQRNCGPHGGERRGPGGSASGSISSFRLSPATPSVHLKLKDLLSSPRASPGLKSS